MATLYQLKGRKEEIRLELEHTEDPELIGALLDELDGLDEAIDDKLTAYACVYKNLAAEQEVIEGEIERLQDKKRSIASKLATVEGRLGMTFHPGAKWSKGPHSLSWRKSEAVQIVDENVIPATYMREILKYEPDKKQLKDDLKAGAIVPGATLQVRQNLQVK